MASPKIGSKQNPKVVPLPNFKKKPVLEVDPKLGKPIKLGKDKPFPMPGIDDKIVRTMPITQKQLGQIKKMYKI